MDDSLSGVWPSPGSPEGRQRYGRCWLSLRAEDDEGTDDTNDEDDIVAAYFEGYGEFEVEDVKEVDGGRTAYGLYRKV